MNKLRTHSSFEEYITHEFTWRLQEISTQKLFIKSTSTPGQETAIRAGVLLLYAHWEGFIKQGAEAILNFVSQQRCKYRELLPCFVVFGVRQHLSRLTSSGSSAEAIRAVEYIVTKLDNTAKLRFSNVIDTHSNLSSIVFANILTIIGMDPSAYNEKLSLIDEHLLRRRNSIAHGEYLVIGKDEYLELSDQVVGLLRQFKDDAITFVALKQYLRPKKAGRNARA